MTRSLSERQTTLSVNAGEKTSTKEDVKTTIKRKSAELSTTINSKSSVDGKLTKSEARAETKRAEIEATRQKKLELEEKYDAN